MKAIISAARHPAVNRVIPSVSILLAAVLLAGCSGVAPRVETFEPCVLRFDSAETGGLPPDFSTALTGLGGPVSWVVREDSTAPDARKVLVQESAETNAYRFPLCLYDKVAARDVAAEVECKSISGKEDEASGIVLRYTPGNYYIARANALENNVILFKTVRGKRSKIMEVPVKVTPGEWHQLRFEANGLRLAISFDGKTVIETNDTTFSHAGKIGLWTKADSVSAFASLSIGRVR